MNGRTYISLDVGAVSAKVVAFDADRERVLMRSERIEGDTLDTVRLLLSDLGDSFGTTDCLISGLTGTGVESLSGAIGLPAADEMVAVTAGGLHLAPHAGSVLSVGASGALFIRLMPNPVNGRRILRDSFRSSHCSCGGGFFIEREAGRMGMTPERLALLATQSHHPPVISSRCTVFAKTDIIHRQQNGVSPEDIAGAICHMVARGIFTGLPRITPSDLPIVLVGGVARNDAVAGRLRELLKLDDTNLLVPTDSPYAAAIGAHLASQEQTGFTAVSIGNALSAINSRARLSGSATGTLEPLASLPAPVVSLRPTRAVAGRSNEYLLGIDVGSTNTKVVCLDVAGDVLESHSVPTRGRPLEAVQDAFRRLNVARSNSVPAAVGVTGSGRRYISSLVGGDVTINEISAHAESGYSVDPDVDTIIDIGGQDAKFLRIDNGRVVRFEMNRVCSAGTGSFLEETAGMLGLDIRNGFAELALQSKAPLDLGDRCTVFMMSELARQRSGGALTADIAAGLAYSVVHNYLSRVVGRHRPGKRILFQGGVAGNRAVVAALERVLGRAVAVHPHFEIAGAIGAAIVAGREQQGGSNFAGYRSVQRFSPDHRSFSCAVCVNRCTVNYVQTEDNGRLCFGGACDRYDRDRPPDNDGRESLPERRRYLIEHHSRRDQTYISDRTIGLPRALHFEELLPFWTTFLSELGEEFVSSGPTTSDTMQSGSDMSPSGACLPLKVAYGHCLDLQRRGVKRLLLPSLANMSFHTAPERMNHVCPSAQAWPYTAAALLGDSMDILRPTIRMALPHLFRSDLLALGRSLGHPRKAVGRAIAAGLQAQAELYRDLQAEAAPALRESERIQAVIFARPYVLSDHHLSSRLEPILRNLDISAIPFDMLPSAPRRSIDMQGMYWYFGKRYLQAAAAMRSLRHPAAIFITSYGCGTDTMLIHLLRDALGGIPLLELEIDQHSDFTGVRTRLEAFFYSLRKHRQFNADPASRRQHTPSDMRGRRILIPRMSDHAHICAAALNSLGYDAEVMRPTGPRAMACGKSVVNSGECLPCTMLAGDMLDYLEHNGHGAPPAFFMISGDGPCRLGQYTYLLRKVLDESGHEEVPIVDMSQDTSFYNKLDIVSSEFKKRFWIGSVALDCLDARYHELRTQTRDRDSLDRVYHEALEAIGRSTGNSTAVREQLRGALTELNRVGVTTERPDVTVAVLGENFVRCNPSANRQIVSMLEGMNAAVRVPHLTEWIYYTNWTARLHCRYERDYRRYARLTLIDWLQRLHSYRLHRGSGGGGRSVKEPRLKDLFSLAADYVPRSFEGETIVSIGRTIDYYLKGIDGIIQVAPFGCMAGTIYETITPRLSEDLNGLPILNLQFDGREDDVRRADIEGFLTTARNWKACRKERR